MEHRQITSPHDQAESLLGLLEELSRWANARLAESPVSPRQFAALESIRQGTDSPREIARRWRVTTGAMTGILDRLEQAGLIARTADPNDRRRLRLVLTEDGERVRQEARSTLFDGLAADIAAASDAERAALDLSLALIRRLLTADQFAAASGGTTRTSDTEGEIHHPMSKCPIHESSAASSDILPVLDPHLPETYADAYDLAAAWRAQGPTARVLTVNARPNADDAGAASLRTLETLFVNDYGLVTDALIDARLSIDLRTVAIPECLPDGSEPATEFGALSHSLITMDPPDHTRLRKLVQPTFTPANLERLRPAIQATADALLDQAEASAANRGETAPNRRLDLVPEFAFPLPVSVISDLLGIPQDDPERDEEWEGMSRRLERNRTSGDMAESRRRTERFLGYLRKLVERKRRDPQDDMISRMVAARDGSDQLSEDEMLSTILLMYGAGHVTTVNLIGNAVVALLTHPEELAKLRSDPSLVRNAIEETLRYWGPAETVGRRIMVREGEPVAADVEIAGCPVAPGELVTLNLAAADRDPARFADPDRFDVGRENANRHVAFGKGIHLCLGAPLARIEGQVAVETLLRRYPDLRLAIPADDLAWSGSILRGFREVPLLF